jgi:hypothetical protein
MKKKRTSKKKIKMEIIGNLDWNMVRCILIDRLMSCETEQDFHFVMSGIYLAMGTEKEIAERRKKMKMPDLDKERAEKIPRYT